MEDQEVNPQVWPQTEIEQSVNLASIMEMLKPVPPPPDPNAEFMRRRKRELTLRGYWSGTFGPDLTKQVAFDVDTDPTDTDEFGFVRIGTHRFTLLRNPSGFPEWFMNGVKLEGVETRSQVNDIFTSGRRATNRELLLVALNSSSLDLDGKEV